MNPVPVVMPLALLAAGESGLIVQVNGRCETTVRLGEMGLKTGATIEMVRSGEPCIVRLGGQQLCLRTGALDQVLVKVES